MLPGRDADFPEAALALEPFDEDGELLVRSEPAGAFFLAVPLAAEPLDWEWLDCAKLAGTPGPATASNRARSAG